MADAGLLIRVFAALPLSFAPGGTAIYDLLNDLPGTYSLAGVDASDLPYTAGSGATVYSGSLIVGADRTWRSTLETTDGTVTSDGTWDMDGDRVLFRTDGQTTGTAEHRGEELLLDGGVWTYRWQKI